jgi:hypothetical protein
VICGAGIARRSLAARNPLEAFGTTSRPALVRSFRLRALHRTERAIHRFMSLVAPSLRTERA